MSERQEKRRKNMICVPIEMPKSCYDCILLHPEYISCQVTGRDVCGDKTFAKKRPNDCPLTEPCPHYIRNKHNRGDDSLCRKFNCSIFSTQGDKNGNTQP